MKLSFDLGVQRTTSEHTPHTVGVTSPPFGAGWPSENRDFFLESTTDAAAPQGSKFCKFRTISVNIQHHQNISTSYGLCLSDLSVTTVQWSSGRTLGLSTYYYGFMMVHISFGFILSSSWLASSILTRVKASTIPSRSHQCAIILAHNFGEAHMDHPWSVVHKYFLRFASLAQKITSHHIPLLIKDTPIWAPKMNRIFMDFPAGAICQRFSFWAFLLGL